MYLIFSSFFFQVNVFINSPSCNFLPVFLPEELPLIFSYLLFMVVGVCVVYVFVFSPPLPLSTLFFWDWILHWTWKFAGSRKSQPSSCFLPLTMLKMQIYCFTDIYVIDILCLLKRPCMFSRHSYILSHLFSSKIDFCFLHIFLKFIPVPISVFVANASDCCSFSKLLFFFILFTFQMFSGVQRESY